MQHVLHDIEKKIIAQLQSSPQSEDALCKSAHLGIDQVRRGIEWLRHKGLVDVHEKQTVTISLGPNGRLALEKGLPERRLLALLHDAPQDISDVQSKLGPDFGPAMGITRSKNWVTSDGTKLSISNAPEQIPEELALQSIGTREIPGDKIADRAALESLLRRPQFLVQKSTKTRTISLTDAGKDVDPTAQGSGIDVTADAPLSHVARTHPLKDVIDEIRETFVTLGFSEVVGNMCQPGFWNFDALFTPQDHPAREMQDTFYLDTPAYASVASKRDTAAVSAEHKKHWGAGWSSAESRRAVLRTHTTCVTIRHIAETKPDSARVFSLGSVFRNEKPSYKHLAEFNQVEGVVVGPDVTLRGLMGIQIEFYRRMGMDKVKFWPTFFPYTEPSLQSMVYNETLGKWIELFGMGIFRPEVTRPLGIKQRVLAWGGGIERIAMLKYGLSDVRELYANRLAWLREART